MKAKIIKKPNITEILKLSTIFDLESPININDYKNIIEFFDENNNLIGFINFIESVCLNYTKTFIKFITFTDKNNLDLMIKQMIEIMKQKNYSYTFFNSDNNSFDKYTINILKSNNFTGDDFLFLNL